MNFKIVSQNLAMKTDPKLLAGFSNALKRSDKKPDLILLQEIVGQSGRILSLNLDMPGVFAQRPWDKEAVGILCKYPISFQQIVTLQAKDPKGFSRTAAMAEFHHKHLGLVRAVTTHLAYRMESEHIRFQQMQEVLAWMQERDQQEPADMIIIGGDFNATPGEEIFQLLEEFQDHNSDQPTYIPGGRRLDYIFLKGKKLSHDWTESFLFPGGRIDGMTLSDHQTLQLSTR